MPLAAQCSLQLLAVPSLRSACDLRVQNAQQGLPSPGVCVSHSRAVPAVKSGFWLLFPFRHLHVGYTPCDYKVAAMAPGSGNKGQVSSCRLLLFFKSNLLVTICCEILVLTLSEGSEWHRLPACIVQRQIVLTRCYHSAPVLREH